VIKIEPDMKKLARTYLLSAVLALLFSILFNQTALSQPPPPPPGGGHGQGGNQGAGGSQGAPIGGGLEILVILGALYAGKKAYVLREEEEEKSE
jgi:hypothetical protein